jgi:membrane-associated PAP2 superfamily phosphatase
MSHFSGFFNIIPVQTNLHKVSSNMPKVSMRHFLMTHAFLPLLILGGLFISLESTHADVWLSGHFFDFHTKLWPYKDHWLIQKLFHKGGRLFYFASLGLILGMYLWTFRQETLLRKHRLEFAYLLLACIAGPLIILNLKNHTHIYCPWDLQIFSSTRPYIRWLDSVPNGQPVGHCFPAAHAGSGFAFVSLYFFFKQSCRRWRYLGLGIGLSLGMLFGITQQMRGAHFLSHDVMALLICWFAALLLDILMLEKLQQ